MPWEIKDAVGHLRAFLRAALSPEFNSRRTASENVSGGECSAAQASIARLSSGGKRRPTIGSMPVAGLPLFRLAFIVDFPMKIR
jgi:hypothetical protein